MSSAIYGFRYYKLFADFFVKTNPGNESYNVTCWFLFLFLKVVSSSSKNTKNPPLVYIKYNVNNKYV